MQKITPDDSMSKSTNLVAANVEQLKALFPQAWKEGKLDFDVLKQLLGGVVDEREERFGLNWHGKRQARQLALTPSTGTLRPCPEDSVDWDTTQNLMIEGDNLEVLKILQKSYAGKVKLIYIDPPYNTGNDFVYPDDFKDNIKNYLELTGQVEGGRKISTNTEASGRFHTDWLNMMYPRLMLARELLRDDGIIVISLDDHEMSQLRSACAEVFGEENFVASVIWHKKYAKQNDSKTLSTSHDYLLVFARRLSSWIPGRLERTESQLKGYKNIDDDPRGPWQSVVYTCNKSRSERPNLYYSIRNPVTGIDVWPDESRVWAFESSKTDTMAADGRLWWGPSGELEKPRLKCYLSEVSAGIIPDTLWFREEVGDTQDAAREVTAIFGTSVFDTPKPIKLLLRCIAVAGVGPTDLVVDFFAGSGTTGHAVLAANVADNGGRRSVLVQLPARLDASDRDQYVAASFCNSIGKASNIAELTKERLRRAGKKIKSENPLFAGDVGFRVFKLASTNIREWDPDRDKFPQTLQDSVEHLKSDRSESDILYELLLKQGLDPCVPIEKRVLVGKDVHSIGGGVLFVCLATSIKSADVEPLAQGIVEWRKQLAPAGGVSCIFRDSAFADDVAKSNLAAILEQQGIEKVRSL